MSAGIWFTVFFIPESSTTLLLKQRHSRTKKRRPSTPRDLDRAREIDRNRTSAKQLIHVWVKMPFVLLLTEPILLLSTLHSAIALGILYVSFSTFAQPFQQTRGWAPNTATLPPFITMTLGILCTSLITASTTARSSKVSTHPEESSHSNYPFANLLTSTLLLTAGVFWFAWTAASSIHWLAQASSCLFVGAGVALVCQHSEAYVLSVYERSVYASSALAATTSVRSLFATGFYLAGRPLCDALHVAWATRYATSLACARLFPHIC